MANKYGKVPVFDVREDRKKVKEFEKKTNKHKGSKFIRTSFSGIGKPYN